MEGINEKKVLNFYLDEMERDSIFFLKDKPWYKEAISAEIIRLREEKEMHNKITICKNLWKLLFEASMSFIDPDRRGYDDLFGYFDEYVNFEELIFASDSFYRDHTMHCLWVYFLGEYIIRNEEFKPVFGKYGTENERFRKMCGIIRESSYAHIFKGMIELADRTEETRKYYDSMRCLNALTHDLGYPIKKIGSINKNIKSILPHFGIKSFNEFDFNYSDVHDNFIKDFLNYISYSFSFTTFKNNFSKEFSQKMFEQDNHHNIIGIKNEGIMSLTDEEKERLKEAFEVKTQLLFIYSRHMMYSKDFENYQHGIMSAFLLFRKLSVFNSKYLSYTSYKDVYTKDNDFIKLSILSLILRAISDHTSEGFQMNGILTESSFLTFIDELEEFSRISRANQNRQYINEFCKSNIYVDDGYMNIDFTFDNTQIDNLDPERAFKGRCKRFLTLFNISELDKDFRLRLRCIGNLPYDKNIYMLEIGNKYACITINGEEKDIPKYLKSKQFLTREGYAVS